MSSYDSMDVCRLCLAKDQHTHQIFADVGEDDVSIDTKIHTWLPIKVLREDKFPHVICTSCHYIVNSAYTLWKTCLNADKQLREWQSNVNTHRYTTVTTMLDQDIMKGEQSNENRLDGSVMQQVSGHQNSMNMDMDNMQMMSIMMPNNNQQQITSVPIDTSGGSIQNIQVIAGSSTQATHDQIIQSQTNVSTQQEEEEDESTDDSEDECDGDEGLPIKEESEEDPNNSRTIEPTTFVNVSLHCDEAGPSGIRQQKISDIQELAQAADIDPKTGDSLMDPLYVPDSNNFIGSSINSLIVTDADYSKHTLENIEHAPEIDSLPEESKHHITRKSETTNAAKQEYYCVKEVTRKQNLNEERIAKKNTDHLWESSECNEYSVQKISTENHNRMYNYSQQTCGQNFSLQGKLNCHDEMSHGLKYTCPKCPYKINRKDSLNKHIKRMHEISYDYECDICVKKFKTKDVLKKHKNLVHTEMQSINCDECNHVSKNLHALKEHKRIKHFKSEFFCKICKQYFRTQDNLEQHSKRHNMACPTCGKTIARYDNLKEHMRLHTNEKPNVCNVYGKAYAQKTDLSMQMKKHSDLLSKSSTVP